MKRFKLIILILLMGLSSMIIFSSSVYAVAPISGVANLSLISFEDIWNGGTVNQYDSGTDAFTVEIVFNEQDFNTLVRNVYMAPMRIEWFLNNWVSNPEDVDMINIQIYSTDYTAPKTVYKSTSLTISTDSIDVPYFDTPTFYSWVNPGGTYPNISISFTFSSNSSTNIYGYMGILSLEMLKNNVYAFRHDLEPNTYFDETFFYQWLDMASNDMAFQSGYNTGRSQFGYYNGSTWLTANEYGNLRYNDARNYFGYYDGSSWLTATEYGNIRYNAGLNADFDYVEFLWAFVTFPVAVANIEIFPGLKIGYFIFFSIALALIGWLMSLVKRL